MAQLLTLALLASALSWCHGGFFLPPRPHQLVPPSLTPRVLGSRPTAQHSPLFAQHSPLFAHHNNLLLFLPEQVDGPMATPDASPNIIYILTPWSNTNTLDDGQQVNSHTVKDVQLVDDNTINDVQLESPSARNDDSLQVIDSFNTEPVMSSGSPSGVITAARPVTGHFGLPLHAAEQPTPAAEQPTLAAEQPTPAAEQPTLAAEQPTPAAEQPTLAAEQPTLAAEQPTLAVEQPTLAAEQPTPALFSPIISQFRSQDARGGYKFSYAGGSSSRAETRDHMGTVRGSYNLVDPSGAVRSYHYIADKGGFRISGPGLPAPPTTRSVPGAPVATAASTPASEGTRLMEVSDTKTPLAINLQQVREGNTLMFKPSKENAFMFTGPEAFKRDPTDFSEGQQTASVPAALLTKEAFDAVYRKSAATEQAAGIEHGAASNAAATGVPSATEPATTEAVTESAVEDRTEGATTEMV